MSESGCEGSTERKDEEIERGREGKKFRKNTTSKGKGNDSEQRRDEGGCEE